jgi:hypothetical protein
MLAAMTLDEFLSAHVQGNINIIKGGSMKMKLNTRASFS